MLIVDDDEIVRRVLVTIAEPFAEAVAVESATMALLYLQSTKFDVVLSDTELGTGPSGLWLLQEVARRRPRVRRCLMSAGHQETPDVFFLKPLDRAALLRLVDSTETRE